MTREDLLHDDFGWCRFFIRLLCLDRSDDFRGYIHIGLGMHAAWLADDDGLAAVRCFADRYIQGYLAEEFASHLFRRRSGAAMVEYIGAFAAMGTTEIAHVFDQPEYGDFDLAKHVEALARVEQGDVLRRRDDDRAGQWYLLNQG